MSEPKLSILGTVGVPANYGGFETLAENLVRFHAKHDVRMALSVYCSSKAFKTHPTRLEQADLRYFSLDANGPQSIIYDILSLFDAARRHTDVILLLGVSGALALPLMRAFSSSRIVTNIDGIEWKREKWRGLAKLILRLSERAAVRWSHVVIADNAAIAEYVETTYGNPCEIVAYGGDHALATAAEADPFLDLPDEYHLALCRIEPENSVAMILDAYARSPESKLVFVGNWSKSPYGRKLKAAYAGLPNITILDPVYDPGKLRWIRDGATVYVHGHSAGGTNPALVEMMHFGIPVLAHGCSFNRRTTEDKAAYFESVDALCYLLAHLSDDERQRIAEAMSEIAQRRYTWDAIGRRYFDLMETRFAR